MKLVLRNAVRLMMMLLALMLCCRESRADTGGRSKPFSSDTGIQSIRLIGQGNGCSSMRVRVLVKNFDPVASVPGGTNLVVTYGADGVNIASEVIMLQQDLAPLESVSHTFNQIVDFSGHSLVHAEVNSPGTDVDPANNGLSIPVHTNGSFTIGGFNPDFLKIQQAIDFVTQQDGMVYCTNAIIFKIRPGVYQESVMIDDIAVLGSSLRLILESETGNSEDVVIISNTTSTFSLKNTRHVTFNNVSIVYDGNSQDDAAIRMGATCKDIHIENSTVARPPDVMGYTVRLEQGIILDPFEPGPRIQGFHAINSKFYYGGISFTGNMAPLTFPVNTDVNIVGNSFLNFDLYGVEVHHVDNIHVVDNVMQSSHYSDGISIWFVGNKATVERNHIRLGRGRMGATVGSNDHPQISIVNNFINVRCGAPLDEVVGLLVVGCKGEVLHNSVRIGRGPVHPLQNKAIVFHNTDGVLQVKNNIFYSIITGAVGVRVSNAQASEQDYNNIYVPYGRTGQNFQTSVFYPDLITWKGATGFDGNSVAEFVEFKGDDDLHLSHAQPGLSMGTSTHVLYDIDQQPRLTPPYLGADEFYGSAAKLPEPDAGSWDENEPISLFPNPVTGDHVDVNLGDEMSLLTMVILNQYGERQSAMHHLAKGMPCRVSVADLPPGLYLLQVNDSSGMRRTIRFEKK